MQIDESSEFDNAFEQYAKAANHIQTPLSIAARS
jgi:hypothetical protein